MLSDLIWCECMRACMAAEGKEKWHQSWIDRSPRGKCGVRAYNGGLGTEPPVGTRGAALVNRSGQSHLMLKDLALRRSMEVANLPYSLYFGNSVNHRYLWCAQPPRSGNQTVWQLDRN